MHKSTKIVATLGPASESYGKIKAMIKAGVNVARLNFSHGSYENHASLIRNIRRAEKELGVPVGIMQDIQGPKIRLGDMPAAGVAVKTGQEAVINTTLNNYTGNDIPLYFPSLEKYVKAGDRLLIDDGHAEFKIKKVAGCRIVCKVVEGYLLKSHKGVNFPDSYLKIPIMSDKDRKDLRFGIKMNVDIIALSFVHTAQDIKKARVLIRKYQKESKIKSPPPVFIVAKIERNEAVKNIDEILKEADGVMVARGDLAMETAMSGMPLLQKMIIEKANHLVKPVIVATQMLDSMQTSRRPTRAEITDVANAVIDHADALMLSNETATGKYPVEAVKTMSEIILTTEESKYDDIDPFKEMHPHKSISKAIAGLSGVVAMQVGAKAILVASATGATGRLVSRVRPQYPVYVGVKSVVAGRQLCLSWGLRPFLLTAKHTVEDLVSAFLAYVKKTKLVKKGDKIVLITGEPVGKSGSTNMLEVKEVK
ncbi:MAG: pyruvate kinase [Candidatus Magasanikbacteria bacterium]|nr:pyruvate kinase [Candidatus Magasanikbacteria bacterium]